MKKVLTLIALFITALFLAEAQMPVAKVDINMEGRSQAEVNEPGYTPWYIPRVATDSIVVSGITFRLTTFPKGRTAMRASWSKALVQSPYYTRLVNDGVKIDNDSMIAHPNMPASLELKISGLPVGKHTLQTYHNIWEDTTKINHSLLNVYLNGSLIHSRVRRSVQAKKNSDGTVLLTELNVTKPGQTMTLRIDADTDFVVTSGKTKDLNVCIDGFELNTDDASKQACEPNPSSGDFHANADSGYYDLGWKACMNGKAKTHTLYFGTDSMSVSDAMAGSPTCKGTFPIEKVSYRVDGLYNLNTYYWRVDETDSSGIVTKGKIWSFCPRHIAFRGAEGYGRFATGGRGGKAVYVTNLNDSGPGSFRDAVTQGTGPRTVIFNVSGIIYLQSRLVCDPFVTVAGQTAPGKGVCFRAAPVGVGKESITRFIRVRLGGGTTYDGMGMAGVDHGIIDHCSVSWTIDEAFSSRNGKNLTLQNTLISEALNIAGHQNYPAGTKHGYAGSIGGDIGSFHHNLLAHCEGRNWSMAGGLDGAGYYAGRLDLFNNVVYNWGGRACDGGAHEVNFVNNYYKKGASTTQNIMLKADLEGTGRGSQSYYFSGNVQTTPTGYELCNGSDMTCSRTYTVAPTQVVDWTVFVNKPFFPSYATIDKAKDAYKSVLSDAGCNMPILDNHDKRIVRETKTGTYTYFGSVSGDKGLIDNQNDAGGYEVYPEMSRAAGFDSDWDGLPDWWEKLHETNLNSASGDFSDANADNNKDGYTSLEDYLEWMSVPHYYMRPNLKDTIVLSTFTAGYDNPAFSCENAGTFNLQFKDSAVIVTPTSSASGISYLDFMAKDSEGSIFVKRIGICIGATEPITVGMTTIKKEADCKIYPSLFDKDLNLELVLPNRGILRVSLCDINGKTLRSRKYTAEAGSNDFVFECPSSLPSQFYLVRITDKSGRDVCPAMKVKKK